LNDAKIETGFFLLHILIVKLGSIGDIVHTLPALAAIKRAMGARARVSWVVERRAAEILRGNTLLEHLIEIDTRALRANRSKLNLSDARSQLRHLRASAFDVAIDFQGLIKSGLITRLSGARERYGFDRENLREPAARFFLTQTVKVSSGTHIIEKNLALAAGSLNIAVPRRADEIEFPIFISHAHRREAEEAAEGGRDFAILNPGGGWPTKLWSADRYSLLADALWMHYRMFSLITHGGGDERALAESIVARSRSGAARAVNVSLKGFFALAERARVYVGGDTGPTHLAVAARAPVVGLFGPTEWWRNGSPRPEDICVQRSEIGCRENCHRRSCSKWICMDIETERVLASVEELLRRDGRPREATIAESV
jgi:heptosyltransferase I